MSEQRKPTTTAFVLGAWLIVGVPFSWGLYNSWLNIRKLFNPPPAATAPAPVQTPAAK